MKKSLPLSLSLLLLMAFSLVTSRAIAQAGGIDLSFNPGTGVDGDILATALQSDGSIIIAGSFTNYNGVPRSNIARVTNTGSLDASFNPGIGANNTIKTALLSNTKVIIGGSFTAYNTVGANRLTSLNDDGSLNTSFAGGNALNPFVSSLALQGDGKIIIGGNFTTYNFFGPARKNIARINTDGTLDTTFNPGTGANSQISCMAFEGFGGLIIAGTFTSFNNSPQNHIARINPDGSLDLAFFNTGTGANGEISAIAIQDDDKIVIGGWFTSFNGITQYRLARINPDGSLDGTFNSGGAGPNQPVSSLAIGANGTIIVAGSFTTYNGVARKGFARIFSDGSLDTGFDPGFGVTGGTVHSMSIQGNNRIIIGGSFTGYDNDSRHGLARVLADGTSEVRELNDGASNIFITPNPATDYITITDEATHVNGNYTIYNMLGQLILTNTLIGKSTSVAIDLLPKGPYILQVGTSRRKFIKN